MTPIVRESHTSANDFRVKKVLSKIGYDPALSVKGLAKLVKLSSSRLGHLFKAETGVELRHFLVDSRLEKAAQLLLETDLQIKEISHTIGYRHVPSFDRVFRRKFMMRPADYRRYGSSAESSEFAAVSSVASNDRGDF